MTPPGYTISDGHGHTATTTESVSVLGNLGLAGISSSLTASGEIRANTTTAGDQSSPSVAVLAAGGHVAVWTSPDGSGTGIYSQRFDGDGVAMGAETKVSSYISGSQSMPSVAALAGGGYVVGWASETQDSGTSGIYSQRFDANGIALGGETQVNAVWDGYQYSAQVTALSSGYLVSWASSDSTIRAQRYDGVGNRMGAEFQLNTYAYATQSDQSVVALADGGFVLAWTSGNDRDGSGTSVYAQRFYGSSATPGGEFRVNTTTLSDQRAPSVAVLTGGSYVVVWHSSWLEGNEGIYGQRYNADGSRQGGEFHVNSYTTSEQNTAAAVGTADGGFVVTWQSYGQDGAGYGAFAQRYRADGSVQGGEFRINTFTAGDQTAPAVAARSDGGFVTAWTSTGEDGSQGGIYSNIYSSGPLGAGIVSGTVGADTLYGSSGNDTLVGGTGADTYMAGNGSGADAINNTGRAADDDKVLFGANIATDQLWFQQAANDLKVSIIGTNDSVTVSGWFASGANHVATLQTADGHTLADTAVQNLVAAMASMTPPPIGQTTLTTDQHTQLDTVIAANWQSH